MDEVSGRKLIGELSDKITAGNGDLYDLLAEIRDDLRAIRNLLERDS